MPHRLVVIESPYAGDVRRNLRYARSAVLDSLARGEAPFASHLLYTQPGILDDDDPAQRLAGILAGFSWAEKVDLTAVYTDLGVTGGMELGVIAAQDVGRPVEYRSLEGWK